HREVTALWIVDDRDLVVLKGFADESITPFDATRWPTFNSVSWDSRVVTLQVQRSVACARVQGSSPRIQAFGQKHERAACNVLRFQRPAQLLRQLSVGGVEPALTV